MKNTVSKSSLLISMKEYLLSDLYSLQISISSSVSNYDYERLGRVHNAWSIVAEEIKMLNELIAQEDE